MSDYIQIFVPDDMYWQPTRRAADSAVAMLRAISPDTDSVTAKFSDVLHFEDCGENWSGVFCPACGGKLDAWFWEVMGEGWKTGFKNLAVTTPCCGLPSTLNDLSFGYPVAFCRFSIRMKNSMLAITEKQMSELADCLGCELSLIWQHI